MNNKIDVLIGDNSINFGYICSNELKRRNISALAVCKDGIDILNSIIKHKPSIAVIEYNMPHIDALGVLSFMKYFLDLPIKIIVIGTNGGEAFKTKLFESGADDYFLKPFDISALNYKIMELLEFCESESTNLIDCKIESIVENLIVKMGFPINLKGTLYIREALIDYIKQGSLLSVTKTLYPDIAKKFNTSPANIERSIRHVLHSYWSKLNREIVEEYFTSSASHIPTNSMFISTVGYKLKNSYFNISYANG